jgi:hypothetical protein
MTKQMANKILKKSNDYTLYEEYSGRSMYGKTTIGVIVPSYEDCLILCRSYSNLRCDNLGKQYIVY